jgi:hypothetical protein
MRRKEDLIFHFQTACREIKQLSIENSEFRFILDSNDGL